jgi:hypothetical protein
MEARSRVGEARSRGGLQMRSRVWALGTTRDLGKPNFFKIWKLRSNLTGWVRSGWLGQTWLVGSVGLGDRSFGSSPEVMYSIIS